MTGPDLKQKNGEHPRSDVGQQICLFIFLVVWVADSFFMRTSTFLSGRVPLYVRLGILGVILVTAVYLVRSGHTVAGHDRQPQDVVTSGAFRHVRHPLYLGSVLTYLGLTISTASLLSLAVLVGIFVFYDYIAGYEERLLEARFGEQYRRYKDRTGKWLPRVGGGR
ncbi:MAG: isoprenylcysteine carboxylmethyltransferase family protein [Candidatus Eisenbacteria bacterium]|nr:isoprenylcysteine carboxylmethyltransferase family protein [Candidatus Eisenbacteria bacterium]